MGVVQRFERRLQGLVGDAFARVFGGGVVPQEVAHALQREAEDGARPLMGGRTLAPNRYVVTLGASDHARFTDDEQRVIRLLSDCVQEHLAEHGWDIYGDVVVSLQRSETLHTGQFRTSSSVDPDASARPRTAGDPGMSQHSGQHPDERRGPYGGYGYDQGYDPDYGYDQGYGRHHGPPYGYEPAPGYAQPYGPQHGYGPPQPYGPGHEQGYDPNHDHNYGQHGGYGYGPGGYGYDQSYGQASPAPPGYDQSYGQYAGYDYDPGYGAPGGYPPDPGQRGGVAYPPPGSRQLSAMLMVDDGSSRSYQLTQGSNVIGRSQDAQFRLPDTGVSRRHLEITWDGQTAMLADLGSTNGTTVNGTPVQTWQLADGDVIRVGNTSLMFRFQA